MKEERTVGPVEGSEDDSTIGAGDDTLTGRLARMLGREVDPRISLPATVDVARAAVRAGAGGEVLRRLIGVEHGQTRYELRGEIARGGMGAILEAWDTDLRRPLAMKVVLARGGGAGDESAASVGEADPKLLGRFLEEAQITGQLEHPGIVPVYELGLDPGGRVYFTMPLVRGRDLRAVYEMVRTGKEGWNRARVLGVLLKVCDALAFAHTKGVIHRDLKPANVMVGRFGEVYVMDWGVARVMGRADTHDLRLRGTPATDSGYGPVQSDRSAGATRSGDSEGESELYTMDGEVVGTPSFMPPEQARGQLDRLDARADVYAVGAMLYQLLAGHAPYAEDRASATPTAILMRLIEGPPAPLERVAPDAPPELVAICEKAMARALGERYPDVAALREDLSSFLEDRVVRAYEAGPVAELRKWVRRNRPLAAALAAALAIAFVGVGAVGWVEARGRKVAEEQSAIAEEQRSIAETNERAAEESAARARRERANVLRLSAFQELEDLRADAETLWPMRPERAGEYEAWLARAAALVAGLDGDPAQGDPGHRAQLAALREHTATDGRDAGAPLLAEDEERWWAAQLTRLIAEIEAFADAETGWIAGRAEPFGWGVERRLEFARTVVERSVEGDAARALWEEAAAAVLESEHYGGLALAPMVGLLPIGADLESGLWEFAHLASGEPAERDARGMLEPHVGTGIVLVLVPGGSFRMGAQGTDPLGENYDRLAEENEAPVHEVTLAPYLVSKYELTQAQWRRLSGGAPSFYGAGGVWGGRTVTGLHPVEQVSWDDAMRVLVRFGLELPTEAQWEHAARAGSDAPWWPGPELEYLEGVANLCDAFAHSQGAPWRPVEDWLDDGFLVHAPVGSFLANPFGLHDVHGNVLEWCRDAFGDYDLPVRPDTGERAVEARPRVYRGGSFHFPASFARSGNRLYHPPDARDFSLGLRPARGLE